MNTHRKRNIIFIAAAAAALALMISLAFSAGGQEDVRKPITVLECSQPGSNPELADLGNGKAAVFWKNEPEEGEASSCLDVVDVVSGKRESTLRMGGIYELYEAYCGGSILMCSDDGRQFTLLDEKLNAVKEFTVPEVINCGEPSFDLAQFWYVEDERLFRMDTAAQESTPVQMDWGMHVAGIESSCSQSGMLNVRVFTDEYESETCAGAVNAFTGEFAALGRDLSYSYCDSDFFAVMTKDPDGETILSFGAPGEDLRTARKTDFVYENGGSQKLCFAGGSPFMTVSHEGGARLVKLEQELTGCELSQFGWNGTVDSCRYLPEEGLVLASGEDGGEEKLLLIDPSQLVFTKLCETAEAGGDLPVDMAVGEAYAESVRLPEVRPELVALRLRANETEERFGVTILLSDQIERPAVHSGYEVAQTSTLGIDEEKARISAALDTLDSALSLYPEGFFRQFRTNLGEGGIRLLLTGKLNGEAASAVGVAFSYGQWDNILLDISSGLEAGTFCHEMWHITESVLSDKEGAELFDGTWDSCNPEGFEYYLDYDTSKRKDWDRWLYFYEPENAYFIDTYSKTFPSEDRARIMEYVMGGSPETEEIMRHPALRRKLAIMSRAVRAHFDTTGWEDVRWERYPEQ